MPELQDNVSRRLVHSLHACNIRLLNDMVHYVFENTVDDALLRKVFVDGTALYPNMLTIFMDPPDDMLAWPNDYLHQLLIRSHTLTEQDRLSWPSTTGCKYHKHGYRRVKEHDVKAE